MSNVQLAAGTKLYIGAAAPATYNKAGYEAVTWTEVGEISNITGDVGAMYSEGTFSVLGNRGIVKRKGSYDNGNVTVEYGYYRADSGQEDIVAAVASDAPFPFKIVMTDVADTHVYFMALVMGAPISIGGNDDFITSAVPLAIDSVSAVLKENAPS